MDAARTAFELGLSLAPAGEHRAFTRLGPAHAEILLLSGDAQGALREADAMLEAAQRLGLDRFVGFAAERLRALAYSALADHDAAYSAVEAAQQIAIEIEIGGLQLARLHEAAARVALAAGSTERWRQSVDDLALLLQDSQAPALIHALAALRDGQLVSPTAVLDETTLHTSLAQHTAIYTQLIAFERHSERASQALTLLTRDCEVNAGQLLLFGEHGLFTAATLNLSATSPELLARVEAYAVKCANEELDTATVTDNDGSAVLAAELRDGDTSFVPVLLWQGAEGRSPLAGVLMLVTTDATIRAPSPELVRIVSQCLLDAGDTRGLLVAEEDD